MAKKIAKTTFTLKAERKSPKQKLQEYKSAALAYIQTLRNPKVSPGFDILTVEQTPTGKKPNAMSCVELGAIVGTARQLGKEVRIRIAGRDDQTRLYVEYVDTVPPIPNELYYPGSCI